MFDHIGIEAAAKKFVEIVATKINFSHIPEDYRPKLLEATTERGAYEICRFGIESTWAILQAEDVSIPSTTKGHLVEALGVISRIAVSSQWAGKTDRWQGIQDWAWATYNGQPVPEVIPPVLDEYKPAPPPPEVEVPGPIPTPDPAP